MPDLTGGKWVRSGDQGRPLGGVESDLFGPLAGLVLTESAARVEDCQARSHQAGGDLTELVGAVEDCQVCPR